MSTSCYRCTFFLFAWLVTIRIVIVFSICLRQVMVSILNGWLCDVVVAVWDNVNVSVSLSVSIFVACRYRCLVLCRVNKLHSILGDVLINVLK